MIEQRETLEYIAQSPSTDHGGFDTRTVAAAEWALKEIDKMYHLHDQICHEAEEATEILQTIYRRQDSSDFSLQRIEEFLKGIGHRVRHG